MYVGMRNWRPYIPEVVRQMRADGVEEAAVICMAPQNSRTSVGLYRRAVEAEAGGLRIDFTRGLGAASAAGGRIRRAAAAGFEQAERRGWRAGAGAVYRAQRADDGRLRQPPADASSAGPRLWPGQGADPYAEEARNGGTGGGAGAGDSAMVVCVPEPGRQRRAVAGAERGGDSGAIAGEGVKDTDSAADRVSVRSCGDSLRRGSAYFANMPPSLASGWSARSR